MEETLIQNSEKYKNDSKIVLDVVKLIELTEEELELKYISLIKEKFSVDEKNNFFHLIFIKKSFKFYIIFFFMFFT